MNELLWARGDKNNYGLNCIEGDNVKVDDKGNNTGDGDKCWNYNNDDGDYKYTNKENGGC